MSSPREVKLNNYKELEGFTFTGAEVVTPAPDSPTSDTYRGWTITWDYGDFGATGPDYDASYEGPEDGWVDNGHRVFARTRDALIAEIDAWFDEQV